MPINDGPTYTEKINTVKCSTSHDIAPIVNIIASPKQVENGLAKHQGQKWQQIFDFDKVLKQIRGFEKHHLKEKSDSSPVAAIKVATGINTPGNSLGSNGKNNLDACKNTTALQPLCKQVKRLEGGDMHYYGIVPKQTAVEVVVCSSCRGIYTKVGFNNHMMLQHHSMWSNVSTKISASPVASDNTSAGTLGVHTNDNSEDSVRDMSHSSETVLDSPSDLSGTMSTCSNASTSSSMSSIVYGVVASGSRHKLCKNGSTPGSSSGGSSSGGRSRSKAKHHSSSPSPSRHSSSTHTPATGAEMPQTPSKTSKKGLNVAHISSAPTTNALAAPIKDSSKTLEATIQRGAFSSASSFSSTSSISSTSSTSKVIAAALTGLTAELSLKNGSNLSSADLSSDRKEKISTEHNLFEAPFISAKKKNNSPSFARHEGSIDSSSSSSSSLEYEQAGSRGTSLSYKASSSTDTKTSRISDLNNGNAVHISKPGHANDLMQYSTPITNLEQDIVSSVNKVETGRSNDACQTVIGSLQNCKIDPLKIQCSSVEGAVNNAIHVATSVAKVAALNADVYPRDQNMDVVSCEEPISQTVADDNSILTLEDMLDSKFINEILNTAEAEIHFDETELETAASQQAYMQQPAAKRMRYTDGTILINQQQQPAPELANEFAAFQQEQFAGYNGNNLEESGAATTVQYHASPAEQHQIIDTIQLQQLLYQQQQQQQQQQALEHFAGHIASVELQTQQPQPNFNQTDELMHSKQIIDLCAEEDSQKQEQNITGLGMVENKLAGYGTLADIGGAYEQNICDTFVQQFTVFNVPSLTDEPMEAGEEQLLLPTIVQHGNQQQHSQYVLPPSEEQLIYEITTNNQVAVLSQQRQQQMIAEFLTQAGYEQVEQIQTTPTNSGEVNACNNSNTNNAPWNEVGELLEFDFSSIETAKSLVRTEAPQSPALSNAKYHEDCYLNSCIYLGIPRPLAINCFGFVKMPHSVATTFRKYLLSIRKANNSPIALSSCLNGVVGTNSGTIGRFTNSGNTKPANNIFAAISGGNNEFSIGSITISNTSSPTSPSTQQTFAQQKQSPALGPIEITLNANILANGSMANSFLGTQQRTKPRGNVANINTFGTGGPGSKAKSLLGATAPLSSVGSMARMGTRCSTTSLHNNKTIIVNNSFGVNFDRVRCIRRSLIPKMDITSKKSTQLLCKQISELLQMSKSPSRQSHSAVAADNATSWDANLEQLKLVRINRFYDRRNKLLTQSSQCQQKSHQHKQRQQLLRSLSDCSSSIKTHSSSGNSSADAIRVYV